jgi:hypothetical protein
MAELAEIPVTESAVVPAIAVMSTAATTATTGTSTAIATSRVRFMPISLARDSASVARPPVESPEGVVAVRPDRVA